MRKKQIVFFIRYVWQSKSRFEEVAGECFRNVGRRLDDFSVYYERRGIITATFLFRWVAESCKEIVVHFIGAESLPSFFFSYSYEALKFGSISLVEHFEFADRESSE